MVHRQESVVPFAPGEGGPEAAAVCAVVVAYFPDAELAERVERVARQVGAVIVVDNTPDPVVEERLRALAVPDPPLVISNRRNLGIAAALNQGLKHAVALGYDWVLTLDQDTGCRDDMVTTLLHIAQTCEPRPAVVGSNYDYGIRRRIFEVPPDGPGEWVESHTVISSGSLIDARFALQIGGFREDYFIDQVDHEFCLRARSFGRRVVISRKPVMDHRVGDAIGGHSPLREYYIMRNSITLLGRYWRREPRWCFLHLRSLCRHYWHMVAWHPRRLTKVRAVRAGVVDAVAGRMGPCRRSWLNV